ncbi:MAG: glutamate-1-semialdehyde 2,1-aminomutase [Planctomycetes bacterium]|nr:glutamate-1-semialdehyde 2,1-aminomutase [Planctomycetota bacterium]
MTLNTEISSILWSKAKSLIPGGVNSPVRAFKSVGGDPLFIARGEGPYLFDADGNRFVDFCSSFGPLILGHAHPAVVEAVANAAKNGLSFGAPTEGEVKLAGKIASLSGRNLMTRMVNSGTEATMSAIRLARGVTGRSKLVKFSGCYHGHHDGLLVSAGSGVATFAVPDSVGVPEAYAKETLVTHLDDEAALEKIFDAHGNDIACVILEGVPANNGLLIQRKEYVEFIREITEKHGAMMILDEVITGFRLGPQGAAGYYDVDPDILTYGKVIGGGMPVGCYAGSKEVMENLAPVGAVYQAGTLSGNPVAMAAGIANLEVLEREDGWAKLERLGLVLDDEISEFIAGRGAVYERIGSIFWIAFQKSAPRRSEDIDKSGAAKYAKFHRALLESGTYFAPSAYEVAFLSTAMDEALVREQAKNIRAAFDAATK